MWGITLFIKIWSNTQVIIYRLVHLTLAFLYIYVSLRKPLLLATEIQYDLVKYYISVDVQVLRTSQNLQLRVWIDHYLLYIIIYLVK